MFEAFIKGLIWVCFLVIAVYVGIWVLGVLGLSLPAHIIPIIWVIVVLVAILVFYRLFKGAGATWLP